MWKRKRSRKWWCKSCDRKSCSGCRDCQQYLCESTSLAIDIGASISNYAQFDKDGKQRLAGAVDVGAYEL